MSKSITLEMSDEAWKEIHSFAAIKKMTGNFFPAGDALDRLFLAVKYAMDSEQQSARVPTQKEVEAAQKCCEYCHVCGAGLKLALDGELWCDVCEVYR